MKRWTAIAGLGLVTVLAATVTAYLIVERLDLASWAARRASLALGRHVTIAKLHIAPGRWIAVDLEGARLANIPQGSRAAMVELGRLTGEIEAVSLLYGPMVVRRVKVEKFSVLLERTPAHLANWVFGRAAPSAAGRGGRAWMPTVLDISLGNGEIIYRTAKGAEFRTTLTTATMQAVEASQPVRLTVSGAYNGTPVSLTGELQPLAVLREDSVPYGETIHIASGSTTLDFKGTMAEPFDVDGVRGELNLAAPSFGPILGFAGVASQANGSLNIAGLFERTGDLWRLTHASGGLTGNAIPTASLSFQEGVRGKADNILATVDFGMLDLNSLLARDSGVGQASADIPLFVDLSPDPLVDVHLSARQLVYDNVHIDNVRFAAVLGPGKVAVNELALTYLGAKIRATGRVDADKPGGHVSADVAISGVDVQRLRKQLGFGPIPISGKLDGAIVIAMNGARLNPAMRNARVSAAVSMRGGSIAREVVEMASTDVRLLFRKSKGVSSVTCLLAALDMRAGVGTMLPLRIRAADGAIAGNASFDLYKRQIDLTIGSQAKSTALFALDIPVRVSGSFANPRVRPARWSLAGRTMLSATDTLSRLPVGVQRFAQANLCLKTR